MADVVSAPVEMAVMDGVSDDTGAGDVIDQQAVQTQEDERISKRDLQRLQSTYDKREAALRKQLAQIQDELEERRAQDTSQSLFAQYVAQYEQAGYAREDAIANAQYRVDQETQHSRALRDAERRAQQAEARIQREETLASLSNLRAEVMDLTGLTKREFAAAVEGTDPADSNFTSQVLARAKQAAKAKQRAQQTRANVTQRNQLVVPRAGTSQAAGDRPVPPPGKNPWDREYMDYLESLADWQRAQGR
jgi:hypothetical protein